jgi:CubicO group peptidase (beta-lactamase class C family)
MTDMLTYVAANMAADLDSTRGPLAPAMRASHAPRRPAGGMGRIGLAWIVGPWPGGGSLLWHNGATGGYRSIAAYDAARRVGVVVLANSSVSQDDLAIHLLVPGVPLREPSPPPSAGRVAITLPAATLDRYVGEYEFTPTFHIAVTREGDALVAQATNQPKHVMLAESETKFFLKAVDAQLTFEVGATGPATALVLHQGGADQRAPRVAPAK